MLSPNTLNGIRVILNDTMVTTKTTLVKRKWYDRLFSFTPWVVNNVVYTSVPSREIIHCGQHLIMHPATFIKLDEQLQRDIDGSPNEETST